MASATADNAPPGLLLSQSLNMACNKPSFAFAATHMCSMDGDFHLQFFFSVDRYATVIVQSHMHFYLVQGLAFTID